MEPLLRDHPFCTKNDLSKGVRGGLSTFLLRITVN